jgi:butyryl-CoA dehydrogenase
MHSMALLGRKGVAEQGGALRLLGEEIGAAARRAAAAGVDAGLVSAVDQAVALVGDVTMGLASLGMAGQVEDMMRHSVDYLDLFSTVVVAWQWLLQAGVAREKLAAGAAGASADFYQGKLCAAEYWIKTELPRIEHLAHLCQTGEDSYARMQDAWF